MEQITAMFSEMDNDVEFNAEISELIEKGILADVLSAASKRGFNITEADWNVYRISMSKKRTQILTEAELADVSGGGSGGQITNPKKSKNCFFVRNTNNDGVTRSKCQRLICTKLDDGWWICRCWGTDACVDRMHKISGCN